MRMHKLKVQVLRITVMCAVFLFHYVSICCLRLFRNSTGKREGKTRQLGRNY